MSLSKEHLKHQFDKAKEHRTPYVFVNIVAEGVKEIICIPSESFDEKQAFYERSYTDDLVHVMNKNVYIHGLSYGYSTELDNMN